MGAVCAHARPETVAGGRHLVNASEAVHLKPTMVGILWSLPSTTDSGTSGGQVWLVAHLWRWRATRRYADPVAGLGRQLPALRIARDGESVESSGVEQPVPSTIMATMFTSTCEAGTSTVIAMSGSLPSTTDSRSRVDNMQRHRLTTLSAALRPCVTGCTSHRQRRSPDRGLRPRPHRRALGAGELPGQPDKVPRCPH